MSGLEHVKNIRASDAKCPFCHSDKRFVGKDVHGFYFVHCPHCKANGPQSRTLDKAVPNWNKR